MLKYLIFGAGALAKQNYSLFQSMFISKKVEILAFIDNDNEKWGGSLEGIPIISPKEVKKYKYDGISIWSSYEEAILLQLIFELQVPKEKINNVMTLFLETVYEKYSQVAESEIQDVLRIMKDKSKVDVYYFKENARWTPYEAYYDDEKDLYYVLFEGKKVYISRNIRLQTIGNRKFFRDIWYEQDTNSPHLYEEGKVCVEEGDVILDVGACEGNFTIHNIDKIKKGYIVECDPGWLEALYCTFEPYKDKIKIIEACVGEANTEKTKRLDSLCKEKINFLKMDIEGAEKEALRGGKALFENNKGMKCAICTYHRHEDENKINEILKEYGCETSFSKGYMLFIYDPEVRENPELRKGVIRGINR